MKKLFLPLSAVFVYFFAAIPVSAQNKTQVTVCPKGSEFEKLCDLSAANIPNYIGLIISFILGIAVIIAVFFLIWGGIKWILSGGDKGGVEAARNTIIAAIIGLVITFLTFLIISVVGQFFGINLLNFQIPSLV